MKYGVIICHKPFGMMLLICGVQNRGKVMLVFGFWNVDKVFAGDLLTFIIRQEDV